MAAAVARARAAFAGRRWADAYAALAPDGVRATLGCEDLERLAVAAYLLGADDDSAVAWEAAHRAALDGGDRAAAARCAAWLGILLLLRGQPARASGWLVRARRTIEEPPLDCPAGGYVLVPELLASLGAGDTETARDLAGRTMEIGRRFGDPDLLALGTLGLGQALLSGGDLAAGVSQLDDVMVSVSAGETGPVTTGIVYCAVILECMRLYDLRRAAEWTGALARWCDDQPGLVPYRGQCLVHRSQVHQATGSWTEALTTAEAACRTLTDPPHPALGLAQYQQAELHRLVGALDDAATGYQLASRSGHHPMPGLALLELARGEVGAAAAGIRRALQEARGPVDRPPYLAAAVEILCEAGDAPGARAAAAELADIVARGAPSAVLRAISAHATGRALAAGGDTSEALSHLRAAADAWRQLRMPYEAARAASDLARAYAALGDRAAATLELANARQTFADLGARPDLDKLDGVDAGEGSDATAPPVLSAREREVLAQVARGMTNRDIARALVISEHTVGRHLENIFRKLGVTSRAAATAHAYEHDLL